jgi:hypothetical protein
MFMKFRKDEDSSVGENSAILVTLVLKRTAQPSQL